MNLTENFSTFDLGLAATLVTLEHKISEIDKTNIGKCKFSFKEDDRIDRDVNDFWNGDLRINPQKLFDNMKALKNRLYSD